MDIKIGEYVRTKSGFIGKVIGRHGGYGLHYELDVNKEIQENFMNSIVHEDNIVKHSKNIIDLIEVGDYVNGYRIDNIINGVLVNRAVGIDRSGALTPIVQYEQDIKTILTKERYMQNCYTVEGKEEWKKI